MRDELLGALVEGARTAAFAVPDRAGAFDPALVGVTASADATLTGTVERIVDGAAADVFLVAATAPDGVALYAVDASDVQRTPLTTLDLTRPQATIALTDTPGRLVSGPGEAERVIGHALQVGAALLAVEQVGAAQHLLDLSVDYAKSRLQFGRPIGSFQAVKHASPTTWWTLSTPARRRTTRCGRLPTAPTIRRWRRASRRPRHRPR